MPLTFHSAKPLPFGSLKLPSLHSHALFPPPLPSPLFPLVRFSHELHALSDLTGRVDHISRNMLELILDLCELITDLICCLKDVSNCPYTYTYIFFDEFELRRKGSGSYTLWFQVDIPRFLCAKCVPFTWNEIISSNDRDRTEINLTLMKGAGNGSKDANA